MTELADVARRAWEAGLAAVDPERAVIRALSARPEGEGPVWIAALGKAAPGMVRGVLAVLGDRVRGGVAVVPDGLGGALGTVEVHEASHPIPDARGLAAAERMGALVDGLGPTDRLLVLVSGGGSALLADPTPALGLAGLQEKTRELLASGADIHAINAWRVAHGTLKGGRLGQRALPARVRTLVISDVEGHPERVASGPTAGVGPVEVVGGLGVALDAVVQALEAEGWPVDRGPRLVGEAREVGRRLGHTVAGSPGRRAWVLGGECTVTLRGSGAGGRCQELATAAALALHGTPSAVLLAAGTDGRDGPTDAAGALVDGSTADQPGAERALATSNTHRWLDAAGALIRTGPTGSNVGDLVVALRR